MPAKKYRVRLSEEERQELKGLVCREVRVQVPMVAE